MSKWKKTTRTKKKSCAYQNSCSWSRKPIFLHMCNFPLRDVTVYTRMCVHMCAQKCLPVHLWVWAVGTDLARWWKLDSENRKVLGKCTWTLASWSQGIDPCYLTERISSKWKHSGAPRMPGRKERQEGRAWGVCRGKSTTPAIYEKSKTYLMSWKEKLPN